MLRNTSHKIDRLFVTKHARCKNGSIQTRIWLSAALQYFLGGSVWEIQLSHGMSRAQVYKSIWMVTDAINRCPSLMIDYPQEKHTQEKIAQGFKKKSTEGFDNCWDVLMVC